MGHGRRGLFALAACAVLWIAMAGAAHGASAAPVIPRAPILKVLGLRVAEALGPLVSWGFLPGFRP